MMMILFLLWCNIKDEINPINEPNVETALNKLLDIDLNDLIEHSQVIYYAIAKSISFDIEHIWMPIF